MEITTVTRSKAVAKALGEIGNVMNRVSGWDEAAALAEEFLESPARGELDCTVSIGWSFGSINGVCLHVNAMTKVADIVPVLNWFAKRGLKLKGKPEDYPELQRRTWDLGDIKILGFFRRPEEGGSGCRFVEVGKKEEPVYNLLCDEAEAPESSGPVAAGAAGANDARSAEGGAQ